MTQLERPWLRLVFFGAAWFLGWMLIIAENYDGLPSLIVMPFVGFLWSITIAGAAVIAGLALRLPALERAWNASYFGPMGLLVVSILVLSSGERFGWTQPIHDKGGTWQVLDRRVAWFGNFLHVFAIANWPLHSRAKATPEERGRRRIFDLGE